MKSTNFPFQLDTLGLLDYLDFWLISGTFLFNWFVVGIQALIVVHQISRAEFSSKKSDQRGGPEGEISMDEENHGSGFVHKTSQRMSQKDIE